jgi:integrase
MKENTPKIEKKNERMKEKRALYEAKFESVERWRNGVLNNTSGSSQTKMTHLNYLIKACEVLNMNPDEIIEARIEDLKSTDPRVRCRFEDEILRIIAKFRKENGYYIGREISTCMKSFFFHNHVPLTIISPKVKDPKTYTPAKEAIEKLYQMARPGTERFRISFVFQSLMRRGSVPHIKYRHIKKDFEAGIVPVHIHLDKEEVKGEYFDYDTFIGKQAIEDLRLTLEQRERGTRKIPRETISAESPLLRKENTKKVEPLDAIGLTTFFVSLSRRAGLGKKETITPHALRRAGNTIVDHAKIISLNELDLLMGHRPRSAQGKHYIKPTVEELRAVYVKVEPYLTLGLMPHVDVGAFKPVNDALGAAINKNDRIETKPIEKLTDQEIAVLFRKRQYVQQSLNPYFSSLSTQIKLPDPQKTLDTCGQEKTSCKIGKKLDLLNYID